MKQLVGMALVAVVLAAVHARAQTAEEKKIGLVMGDPTSRSSARSASNISDSRWISGWARQPTCTRVTQAPAVPRVSFSSSE
jgi:hypothetical protein